MYLKINDINQLHYNELMISNYYLIVLLVLNM